jgi:hypothetical protein
LWSWGGIKNKNMAKKTIAFSEVVKGFPTFYSFLPEWMSSLNNNFYSVKDGQLYIHNSENVPHNTFYGVQYPSKVSLIVNNDPSTIKELQAVSLEGNYSWDTLIQAYVSNVDDAILSSIDSVEFVKKEGLWYAYARRNQSEVHFDSKSTYGIGVIQDIVGTVLTVNGRNTSLTSGDDIIRASDLTVAGTVISATRVGDVTTLTVTSIGGLLTGDFIVGRKDPRVEGGNLRGYTMRMDLEIQKDTMVELFAVNSEIMQSYT